MKNRGLLFLGGVLLVTALLLAIVSGLITPDMLDRERNTAAESLPPNLGGTQTAKEAYEQVSAWADTQNIESECISILTTLQKGEISDSWTFQIYNTKRKELLIVLAQGEDVRILREQRALYTQHPFSSSNWSVDSNAVLSAWWAQDGQSIWPRSNAHSLNLHLGQDTSGALAWTVTVLDEESEVLDVFRMHAETGAIIPLSRG